MTVPSFVDMAQSNTKIRTTSVPLLNGRLAKKRLTDVGTSKFIPNTSPTIYLDIPSKRRTLTRVVAKPNVI